MPGFKDMKQPSHVLRAGLFLQEADVARSAIWMTGRCETSENQAAVVHALRKSL